MVEASENSNPELLFYNPKLSYPENKYLFSRLFNSELLFDNLIKQSEKINIKNRPRNLILWYFFSSISWAVWSEAKLMNVCSSVGVIQKLPTLLFFSYALSHTSSLSSNLLEK